ncbi:MAG: ABC transporter substrate-binding protein [Rhodocyclaceae bacterium]|nr:MAG: ABC transporter substrate-binding protein [Rhodocyclaceae bacterium]
MKQFKTASLLFATLILLGGATGKVAAETDEVKIALQFGIGYLPLAVMQHDQLIEKHLKAAGLGDTKVTWTQTGAGSAMNDALLAGGLHFASGGIPPLLLLWDKTRNNLDVRGVGVLTSMPNFLNTRNQAIKSIKDFTEKDRIAIAGAGSSVQTIYLQMAVAQAYGDASYNKLSTLMVNLAHPDGMAAMLSGQEVNSHFTSPPFQYQELENPGVRKVLSSYDIMGGPGSFLVVWSTGKFRNANPRSYAAVFAALGEATESINRDKKRAAEIYLKVSKSKDSLEKTLAMLNDPEVSFGLAPERIMKFVEFMNKVGTMKTKATSWKDLFFPEVHGLSGS